DFHVTGVQTCALPISASSEVTNASTGLRLRNERSYSSASATIHDDSADGSNRLLLKFFDIPPRKAPHPFFDFCNNTAAIVLMVRSEERRVGRERKVQE